jgi:predicted transcriptional regulator YdeE
MENVKFDKDIKVFGIDVKTFPNGIGDAFDELIKKTGDCAGDRNYYGISEFKNGKMFYYATAQEEAEDEAKKYNYESYTIERGEYFTEVLKNWKQKTNCIKDVFIEMMKSDSVNKAKPCIEWYKNDEEMLCMMKAL